MWWVTTNEQLIHFEIWKFSIREVSTMLYLISQRASCWVWLATLVQFFNLCVEYTQHSSTTNPHTSHWFNYSTVPPLMTNPTHVPRLRPLREFWRTECLDSIFMLCFNHCAASRMSILLIYLSSSAACILSWN
jgi:hypothetical protein